MKSHTLTPRQWGLYRLIRENSIENHRKTTLKEICESFPLEYTYSDDSKSHDPCPSVWSDINAINNSYEIDKIIILKNFEYWIGSEEETVNYIKDYWDNNVAPRLARYWNIYHKSLRNGEGKILDNYGNVIDEKSHAKQFREVFNSYNISEQHEEQR